MEKANQDWSGWETQGQVDASLAVNHVSHDQIVRWRHEGLLPDVAQETNPYAGSVIHYPPGTCAQIAAAARLFKVKNRVEFVGWQLWWEGFPVDEEYWRPQMLKSAQYYDNGIKRIIKYFVRDDDNLNRPTLQERVARSRVTNIIMSRIRGRLSREGLAAHIGVALSVATGEFHQSDWKGPTEERGFDQARTIEAMDLEASRTDTIFGKHFVIAQAPACDGNPRRIDSVPGSPLARRGRI